MYESHSVPGRPDHRVCAWTEGRWELYLKQLGSRGDQELTPGLQADNTQPAFSPDGRQLAFGASGRAAAFSVMDLASGAIRRIVNSGYHPGWSPDGKRIAFSTGTFIDPAENSTRPGQPLQIVDVAPELLRPLLPANVFEALQPEWSPNGARLAFWGRDDKGIRDIWTIPAESDGSGELVSATHDIWTDWSPTWSPDGRFLYYASDRGGSMNLWDSDR